MLAFGRCWRLHIHGLFQPNKDSAAGGVYLPIIYHLRGLPHNPKSTKFARKLPNFDTFQNPQKYDYKESESPKIANLLATYSVAS